MSYILDALKKADAEREREGVPTLHTRHGDVPEHGAPGSLPAARLPWLLGGLFGGAMLVLAGWWALAPTEPAAVALAPEPTPRAEPSTTATNPTSPTAAPTAAPVQPMARPQPTAPAAQPMPPTVPQANPSPAPAVPQPPTTVTPERKAGGRSGEGNALRVDASLREATPRVVPVSELPEDVRRELPALSIGGAMHSDVPASRMLILNGSVFHEGDQPAPGLVLEEIKLKSAVFRFKGHRYSVAY